MKVARNHVTSIRDRIASASDLSQRFLWGGTEGVCLEDVLRGTGLGGRLPELSGRSVLIATRDQLAAALALSELDGVARRLIICPPDLPSEHLPAVIARAGVDAIVSDHELPDHDLLGRGRLGVPLRVICSVNVTPAKAVQLERCP